MWDLELTVSDVLTKLRLAGSVLTNWTYDNHTFSLRIFNDDTVGVMVVNKADDTVRYDDLIARDYGLSLKELSTNMIYYLNNL